MFEGENRALARASSGVRSSFWTVHNQTEAAQFAGQGAWLAGWFAFGYFLSLLLALSKGDGLSAIISVVCIAAAGGLAFFIRRHQARWACLILTAWTVLEASVKLWLIVRLAAFGPGALVVAFNLVLIALAVRSLRGAFKLATYRRDGYDAAEAEKVFE